MFWWCSGLFTDQPITLRSELLACTMRYHKRIYQGKELVTVRASGLVRYGREGVQHRHCDYSLCLLVLDKTIFSVLVQTEIRF